MINQGNRILILFHLCCCSEHKKILKVIVGYRAHFVTLTFVLIQNIIQAFSVFYLYILFTIGLPLLDTVITNLSLTNMLYSLQKIVILHPYLPMTTTSPQWPLSSIPKVAVVERFNCMQFFRKVV